MADARSNYRNWPMRVAAVLFLAVVVTLSISVDLAARMTMSDAGRDDAHPATFSLEIEDGEAAGDGGKVANLSDKIEKPGDSASYTFKVRCQSEVSVRYGIAIEYDGSMPLEFAVARDGGATVLTTTVAQLEAAIAGGKMPFAAQTGEQDRTAKAPNTGDVAETYVLTAMWPYDANELDYANDAAGELTVYAIAEQVD